MLQKLGRYEIVEELGRGAMGVIYKAKDPVIGRYVAIKTIRLGDFTDAIHMAELHSRLMREAQSAGVLSHPNIITIFDIGEEAGLSYFAMELVEGATLEHIIESAQHLDEPTIVSIARQTADALGFAHQHGIVHRDIKPANVMLTQDGRVKVADFGIAKVGSTKMTQTGMLLGSPSYMAPEHFLGKPLDGRSDIFALGILMYELITGQPPFAAENLGTLSYKIVHEDPVPPIQLKPAMNPRLNALVAKALARDPAARFQTAQEMCTALDALDLSRAEEKTERVEPVKKERVDPLLVRTVSIPAPVKKRRRVGVWFLVGFLLLIGAAAIIAILFPTEVKENFHVAKEKLKPWIGRVKEGLFGSQPEPPTQSTETQKPTAPANEAGDPSSGQSKPAESPAEPLQAPPSAAETPPSRGAAEDGESNSKTPPIPSPGTTPPKSSPSVVAGAIVVTSSPPGAEIVFDDKQNSAWTTPYTFQDVSKGRHTFEIRKTGYVTERRIVVLLGNESQRVSVVLTMASGMLNISTVPGGASIYVDGELKREVTPANLKVPAGARRILLRKEGYRDVEQVIEIEDNSITTLNQPLAPAP